jgi:hypothetical protein
MQVEQQLAKIEDPAFVDRAHQVIMRMQSLLSSKYTPFARMEIETSEDWCVLREEAKKPNRSEALVWLEELLAQLSRAKKIFLQSGVYAHSPSPVEGEGRG